MAIKIISKNRKASFNYFLQEKFEAGLALTGTEVKSLRQGKVSLVEAYITIDENFEAWINNMNIAHYEFGNINNHKENRKRKLLLNRKEIIRIHKKVAAEGLTVVPTIIYFKKNYVKVEIALAKGKKLHDKREDQAKKDVERKLRQAKYD